MRTPRWITWYAVAWIMLHACAAADVSVARAREDADHDEFFEKRVRPVLAGVCFRCHGGRKVSGGLRVDSRQSLIQGGDSGAAIELDQPDQSLLLQAIRRQPGVSAMPPDSPLADSVVADLTAWIQAGAPWAKTARSFSPTAHWAFQPIRAVDPPTVHDPRWPRTEIDRFLLAKLESLGRKPSPPASRSTLLRRVTFDLIGLPPTLEELSAFERDDSADAFTRVVDRLLASPAHGEHWGRHWLDVVRYADTAGENTDHPLPHAWRYRNWVIQALNQDKPYDQFIQEQVAGDLIAANAPEAPEQAGDRIVATGYLAIARRFGHDISKDMHLTLEDTIDTLGKSVLGLSLGCCRCHDHKFDPLSNRDYYGLYGIFESTQFAFPGCEPKQQPRDLVPLPLAAEEAALAKRIDQQAAVVDREISRLGEEQAARASSVQKAAGSAPLVISAGKIEDGRSADLLDGANSSIERLPVKRGEVVQLAISPLGNHGADSTLVDFEITEIGGEKRRWSVADLVANLLDGNPHADARGHGDVWCFLDLQDGVRFLSEPLAEIERRRELQAWRNGDTPSVFVNSSKQDVKVWTELAAGRFFMHPGPKGPVALAWISPFDGVVSIKGRVADAHPGGDGVGWRLEQFPGDEVGRALTELGQGRARLTDATRRRAELLASRPLVPLAYAVADGSPRHARIQKRGEPSDLGDEVPRKFLDILGGRKVQATQSSGRLELAQWLTAPANPLTARVIVNRVWQWHFGQGLVATPNDFGTRGAEPTHPELLDHLAAEFIRSGWSLKALHRRILLSAAYQQASRSTEFSPWYDSFPRRRLTAEELRDALLAVTDELDRSRGGAFPFPSESTWSFTQHAPFAAEYETQKRSVYIMQKRNRRGRYFSLFDGPDPNASTPRRDVTIVPTQALYFLNDPFPHERAKVLATKIVAAGSTVAEQVDFACHRLFCRPATAADVSAAAGFLRVYSESLSDLGESSRPLASWTAYARVLLSGNEFLFVD